MKRLPLTILVALAAVALDRAQAQSGPAVLVVNDTTTSYVSPGICCQFPCFGTCDLSPSYNHYAVSSPFSITKITFNWANNGGNNCDGFGNYGAFISNTSDASGILASSKNSVYLGCAGFSGGNRGTGELDFVGQMIPSSFYLDFASVDGGFQGGSAIVVNNVEIWGAGTPPGMGNDPTTAPAFASEPVNTGNGNYFYQHTDIVIPGRGMPLVFQRSYNSLDNYSGPQGANWTHSYNIILSDGGTAVTIKWGDGHGETFALVSGIYVPPPGVFSTLVKNPDGTFVLTQKNQTQYNFSTSGKLTSIRDKNGNTILLTYDGSGNLSQVTDTVGRNVTFSYDANNRITQITDPVGRTASFQYDSSDNLTQATDPAGGVTTFTYDSGHHVTSITLPNTQLLLQNTYDTAGRVISQTGGRGFSTGLAYSTPNPRNTTITDARGNATVHTYDSSLRITTITDAVGGAVSYTYDANNDRTGVTNQNGKTTTFAYDGSGNIMGITDPLGNSTTLTYDSKNNLLTATNPMGKTTTFSYDTNGNLQTIQDALAHITTFAYDGSGQLTSKIDARGHTTTYGYDSFGNLTRITDALSNATTLGYDGIGRLTSITDPNSHTATAFYDALSRLTRISDPLGHQTQFAYDAVGNLTKITDANGNATNYAYDAVNNLVTVTDVLGHVTQYAYDANNNRTTFINAKGKAPSYAYDVVNRLNTITDPLSFVTSYVYDAVGNVQAVTDANGKTNQFAYDALNRLIGISYADGKSVSYAYDPNGNRRNMVDSHGTTAYGYDALDRLSSVTHPGGKVVTYAYDAVGNRSSLTYADGKVVNYGYDAANRLQSVMDWLGRTSTYAYDAGSNLTAINYPNRTTAAFVYDAANRLAKVTDSGSSLPAIVLAYSLDAVGNRSGLNVNGVAITFGYDALYELASAQLGTAKTIWAYDPVGNRIQQVSPFGTTGYTYDAGDRFLTAGATTFTYDKNGNQLTKTIGRTAFNYQYDAANRLTSAVGGGNSSLFSYDGDGNRISQSVGSGTYSYLNDVATALPVVLNEQGPDGNITYAYGLGLIEEFSPTFNLFYHYDGLGSVIALTDARGKPQSAYVYDPWGNALLSGSSSVGTKNKFRFTGEALDPGTGLYYLRARYYDSGIGRLISRDPFQGFMVMPSTLERYVYALNNPTLFSDPSGLAPDTTNSQLALATATLAPTRTPSSSMPAASPDNSVAKGFVSCALEVVSSVFGGCVVDWFNDAATSLGLQVFVKNPQTRSDIQLLLEPSFYNPPSETVPAQIRLSNEVNKALGNLADFFARFAKVKLLYFF